MTLEALTVSLLIIFLFTIRPFIYKSAAKNFSPKTSSIFTAFWTLILCILTLPFFYDKLFVDGHLFIFNRGFIASFLKGFAIYMLIKNSQVLNKESTSAAVFWGPIGFAFGSFINFAFLGEYLSPMQLAVIFVLLALGVVFFMVGDGRTLSRQAKIAFLTILAVVVLNIACDRYALMNTNWYAHLLGAYISMLAISLISGVKKEEILACVNTKSTWIVGILYAFGELVIIRAMQTTLSVSSGLFLIRIAQALGLILAYHIYKEGKMGLQYMFAIVILISSYFYFFW